MSDSTSNLDLASVARLFVHALTQATDEAADAVAAHLADDVVVASSFGQAEGRDGAVALLHNPFAAHLMGQATWSDPVVDGDRVVVNGGMPATGAVSGFVITLFFGAGGPIVRAEIDALRDGPLDAEPLKLTDTIKNAVNNAIMNRDPMLIAYVDDDGQPRLSLRGSTSTLGDDQLGIWLRDTEGGLAKGVAANPRVSMWLHDPNGGMWYEFRGRGRIETSPEVCDVVFASAVDVERNRDWRRLGAALVIDLDAVEGQGAPGRIKMARGA